MRLVGLFAATLANASVWLACDDSGPTFTRVSVEGGGSDDASDDVTSSSADAGGPADARSEAEAASDAAAAPAPVLLATGSAMHPDPAIGYGDHTCVVAGADRSVYCWGANDHGQLGIGTTGLGTVAADATTATRIAADEVGLPFIGLDELSAAAWHTCARKGDLLFCWGERFSGAQTDPPADPATDRTKPRAIGNLDVKALAAGGPHTCALKANGRIACFGHSYFNELGRPRATDPACTAPIFYAYGGIAEHTCSGETIEATSKLVNAVGLTNGETHSCALAGGSVHCWGTNVLGQLGVPGAQVGELAAQQVVTDPTAMTPIDQVTAIAAGGGNHACALRAGKVLCWGSNASGQLGADPAALAQRPNAAAVAGIVDATAIGVADGISCAVRTGGSVWCWGAADSGQLGDGGAIDGGLVSFTPVQIKGPNGAGNLTGVRAVAPGRRHVCVQKTDDTVWCWGKNDRGQLGDGTAIDSIYPVQVKGLP
jgi:alpha-tubulin suppressor-like RCC1 family protein